MRNNLYYKYSSIKINILGISNYIFCHLMYFLLNFSCFLAHISYSPGPGVIYYNYFYNEEDNGDL